MRNIHVLRMLLFVFLAALLNTGASAGIFNIIGAGATQCGKYLEDRRKEDKNGGRVASVYYSSWVAGYLTAWNTEADFSEQVDHLRMRNETIVAYLDKYCRDNPLGIVIEGTDCLMLDVGYKRSCNRDSDKQNKSKLR